MYEYENRIHSLGYSHIAGCDEVGRGPLAGPLVCAAVVLNPIDKIHGLDDSKKLSEKVRKKLYQEIINRALAYEIVFIDVSTIDQINIYQATRLGMMKAINNLNLKIDYVLSDAMPLLELVIPYESIIKGDQKSASIAAASILAKVARDDYMIEIAKVYPEYSFDEHKGYPTKKHLQAIKNHGITSIHRRSYRPVKQYIHSI